MTKNKAPIKKMGITAIFVLIGTAGSIKLIVLPDPHGLVLALTVVSLLGLLVIFFEDVVESFDFAKLTVKLREAKETEREIKEFAVLTVRLAVAAKASAVEWDGNNEADEQFENTAREILEKSGVPASDPLFSEIASAGGRKVTEA